MVFFDFFGLRLALDFTAPALLALLMTILPPQTVLQTVAACLLHECAHLLMIGLAGKKPALLRISAAGMRLETTGTAVCPLRHFFRILAAGPAANLFAACGFWLLGRPEAAAANLSLCLFNLLPFRSTDGGTMLYAWLEQRFLPCAPRLPDRIMQTLSILTAAAIFAALLLLHIRSISLCGMLVFMLLSEACEK